MTQAAFFDLDKTVIAKSSLLALTPQFYREGLLGGISLIRSFYGQLAFMLVGADEAKMEKARRVALKLTEGWEQEKVRRLVSETMEETISPLIYEEALELFAEHRRMGNRIYIISSAPEEVIAPLARMLHADDYVATRAKVVDGRYAGELEFYCYGPNKAEALREIAEWRGYDLTKCYAYSDSITDLPMLEAVGHPCAVNPDRELARKASERGWDIRHFERTVALEGDSTGDRATGKVIAGGVVLAAVAAAAIYVLKRQSKGGPAPGASATQHIGRARDLIREKQRAAA